jgi:hypothetical protein
MNYSNIFSILKRILIVITFFNMTMLHAQIPNNTCDGALEILVQQLGDTPIMTDVIFINNTIESYGTSENPGGYAWCVPNNQSNPNNISVIDNFFSFVAPSSGAVFIVLDEDLDSDMQGSIRSSCTTFNNPVITCLNSKGTNNIAIEDLTPGQSYILSFMVEVDSNTNLSEKNRTVSIFEVIPFVLDCPKARITEIHYDDSEGDVHEFIEITALAGESLAGYTVEVHNESINLVDIPVQYVFTLDGNSTPVPNSDISIDTILFPEEYLYFGFTATSLLPDNATAISLRDPSGKIVDLISYEGNVIVDGLIPLDIIVQENSLDPIIHSLRSQDISGHSIWARSIDTSPNMYNSELSPVIESATAIWQGGTGNWASANWEGASGFGGLSIYNGTAVTIPSGTVTVDAIFENGSDCYSTSSEKYYETSIKSLVSDGDMIVTTNGGLSAEESIVINGVLDINAAISAPVIQVKDMNIGAVDILSVDITGDLQIDNKLSFGIEGLVGAGSAGGSDYLSVNGDLEINAPVEITISDTYPEGTSIPLISYGSFDQVLNEQNLPAGWILENNGSTKIISAIKAERPINDLCQGAIDIPLSQDANVASIDSTSNTYAQFDIQDECSNDNSSRGVWYSINAPEDATYTVSADNFSSNVNLQLFEGDCTTLTSLSCGNTTLSYELESSKSYYILATTDNNQFSSFDLTFIKYESPFTDITPVGINVSQPLSTLDVDGSIRIGNDSTALPGVLRFRRNRFEGFTGLQWKSLDDSNDNLGDHKATQNIDGSGYAIKNILSPSDPNDAATKQYVDSHEDADSDATNELQTLSISNNLISLTDGGTISLPQSNPSWSQITSKPNGFADNVDNVDDADNDPSNEIETWATLSGIPSGFSDNIDNINDADSDDDNERISDIQLTNTILNIEEGATSKSIDLTPIASQWDNLANNEIHYSDGQVGVGVSSSINDRMHIRSSAGENALRVQVGTATKFRVYANGGIALGSNPSNIGANNVFVSDSIGIGEIAPQEKLHIDGGVIIEKNSSSGNPTLNLLETGSGEDFIRLYMENETGNRAVIAARPRTNTDDSQMNFFLDGPGDVMIIRGDEKIAMHRGTPLHPLHIGDNTTNGNGAHLTAGGTWTNGSSRSFKENITTVNSALILQKLSELDIATWDYIDSDEGPHIGPIAEEFYATFGFGGNQKYISTVDADGVALAAIKALYEENIDLKNQLETQNELLKQVLDRLGKLETGISKK